MQPVEQAVAPMVQPLGETVQSLVTSYAVVPAMSSAAKAVVESWRVVSGAACHSNSRSLPEDARQH